MKSGYYAIFRHSSSCKEPRIQKYLTQYFDTKKLFLYTEIRNDTQNQNVKQNILFSFRKISFGTQNKVIETQNLRKYLKNSPKTFS